MGEGLPSASGTGRQEAALRDSGLHTSLGRISPELIELFFIVRACSETDLELLMQ